MLRLARTCWRTRLVARPTCTRITPPRRLISNRVTSQPIAELLKDDQDSNQVMNDVAKWVNARFQAPLDTPSGWSNEWDKYDQLLTLFWPSPYPLNLRQMEMIINIQHRIKGEIVPLLYSLNPLTSHIGKDAFLFEMRDQPGVYLFDIDSRQMYQLQVQDRDEAIMELQALHDAQVPNNDRDFPMTALSPDPEGSQVLERLLQGDTTVTKTLKEGNYLPHAHYEE